MVGMIQDTRVVTIGQVMNDATPAGRNDVLLKRTLEHFGYRVLPISPYSEYRRH